MKKPLFWKCILILFPIALTNYVKAQAPANDNPCAATSIPVGATCTFSQYTTLNATATPGVTAPGCANYLGGDVWFSAVVPASGSISFDTNTGGITDGGMALYTGTCGALTLRNCDDDGSANGFMPSITETGLTPGSTVFIRFWEFGNDNNGTFSICAQAGPSCSGASTNSSCVSANPFCTGVSYDYCNTTGVPSIGGSGIYDCLLSAPNPAFYFMNIATSGPVTFNISQQTFGGVGIDVDFVLWGPFASQAAMCSSIAAGNVVDCSYSTAAVETATISNALAGQWYMMLITNFSDQPGVINFTQTNTGNPGAGATNCNILTAIPGACSGGLYTLTGAVTVPSPPASGTLTVTNSCGGNQVINAPFISPINYSIPNICGNGNNCNVSAVFSAGGAPVILPTTYTAPSCNTLTASPGGCTAGQYVLTGSLTTGCLPATGTLTISSSCGGSVVFNAPFTSPQAWSLPPSNGNGGNCTVTAVYSAAGAPIITPFIFAEPSCCGSDAGTVTVTHTSGTQTTLANGNTQVVLCPGGTVTLTSNGNYILPAAGCIGCVPGLMYAIYTGAGPTVPDPDLDPNWTGYYWTGQTFTNANSGGLNANTSGNCSSLLNLPPVVGYASPSSPTNTLLFVPITADATDLPYHDNDGDGCFDIGNPIAITFLNPITFQPNPGCNGSVSINITGGYPEFFPAFYTITNTGAGALGSTMVSSGGNAVISGLTPGQTYSFSVNDGNGCTSMFSGVYSGNPTVSINPPSATVCTAACVNLVANVTSGVGPGNLTFTSNQCASIPDGGIGAANGTPAAVGGSWAHTNINVAGVCAPAWNTGEGLTVCLNITHSFDGDLNIYLQAPNGTFYLLSDDNGAGGANYTGTCFSATGAAVIAGGAAAAPFSAGPYKPEGAGNNFSGLNGTSINGTWSLWVADDVLGDAGTLNNWSITFTNENTYTYSWAPAAGLSATNILNPTACPAATTTYTLTVTNSCGCPQTATATVNVTASITPTFIAVPAICSGSAAPVLPTTSTNGITGTWSPAVSNTASGTYTFTPDAGQCATTTTLDVTVNPNITPNFAAITAICSGSAAPVLPTTSTNGITGTWSPAVSNTASGTYTFTPDAGQCATTTTLDVTVNPNITPTFAAITAICSGSAAPVLPTTSTNGITGTWAPAVSNTASGTYTFTPDAGQCATATTLDVTVNPNITPTFAAITAICSGSAAPVLPTTSTNGITGTWSPAVSNTASGTYTFTPDAGQCATTTTLDVTVNPNITPTFAAITAICSGSAAPVLPTTSTNGITGTWAPAVSNTASGTYTFTPDAGQCATTTTLDVTVNPNITPTFAAITAICSGSAAPVLPTTSTNGITGTWSPAVSNTASGTYTFTPDAGQCATATTLDVTVNPNITPTFAAITAICSGSAAPVLLTTSTNGITGTWSPAVSNTASGTYTFTPDAGQCATTTTLDVTVNPNITPTFAAITAICSGSAAPVLPTTSTNGITGTWSPAVSNTASGTYTFTPDAGQCATATTLDVTVNPNITPTFAAITAICSGSAAPVLPTTSTNGITGTWSPAVSNTASGTYTFTPDAGQCATATTLDVTVNPNITPTFAAITAICSGSAAPVLPTTSTNGITGTWSPAVSNTASGTYTFTPDAGQCATATTLDVTVNSNITPTFAAITAICSGSAAPVLPTTSTNGITGTWSPAVSNTASGTYTFTPDAGQCANATTLDVTVNPNITPTFAAITAICSGSAAPVLPTTSTNGITGTWSPAVSNTASGTYTFTPDAGQCATATTLDVTVNPNITPTFAAITAICSGSAAPVLPTTSTNGITGTWSPAVSNTASGTYTFTPDAGQCATATTLDVTVNPNITPTFAAITAICSGSAAPVLLTTSTNGITGTWSPAVSNTASGTYTFTPDAGQCATTTTLDVTVNPNITPTFAAITAICSGSAAPVLLTTSTNGITGTWSPAVSNTASGTYTFTPDAGQCATATTLDVTVNPNITPTFAAITAICSGSAAPVLPTTSTNGITGTWSPAVSNTASGTYTFTPDAGQCANATTLDVTVNPNITPTFAAITAICSGSAATVLPTTSTNGITGTWSPAVSNTASGTYTFTPDAGQCATATTLDVTVNPNITPTFAAITAICSGSAAPVLPTTSTNGITGTWTPAVSNTASGTYTFTPDAGQCATATTLDVTVNPNITPTLAAITAICSGSAAPVLPTTSTNGITGTWSPAVSNTASGTYTFTPDAGQCATATTLDVTVNPNITPTFAAITAICSGSAAPVLPTTSTNGITGTWSPAVSNTASGTYTFTPDAGQCATATTLDVTVNPNITPTFAAITAICSGSAAPVLPTTSTNGITGTWSPAVSNTASGTYTFTPDAGQCATTTTLDVTVNPNITPNFAAITAICSGSAAPVLPTTSTNGITGAWSPAVSNTASGTYTFTPDAGQCATATTLDVTVNPNITPNFAAITAICSGSAAPVLPTTSTNGITGTWSPAVSNTASGTYTFTPDAGQCATATTLDVTVNPNITPTFAAITAICSGSAAPVLPTTSTNGITGTWSPAVSNTASGTYTFTPDAGQCATATTLDVTVNPNITPTFAAITAICSGSAAPVLPTTSTNGITGTWSPAVSNTASGTYTFTPDAGQCATATTLDVTVNPNITPTFAAITAICSGSAAPVLPTTSTNGITGTWSPAVSNTASGTYTFTPDAGQCATATTLDVTVNPNITPTFAAITAICSGSAAPVLPTTSTNGITGTWTPAVSNTASGTYTFTPDAGQCATATTLDVTVNPNITPNFAAITAICSGSAAPVLPTTSTNGITGTWSPAVSNTASGTYTFTPDAGQCATTTTLDVTVNPNITPNFAAITAICSGSAAPVLPTTSTNGITGTWSPAVSNTASGTYTFTPDAGQCATATTLDVTVNPNITPNFAAITAICSGSAAPVLPTTSTNGITGTWSPAVSNTASGTYTFTPDAGQCATATTLDVTVNPNITPTLAAITAICSGSAAPVLPTTSTNGITGTWSPAVSNTASGTYTFTPDAGQCATTTTTNIIVTPVVNSITNANSCSNLLPYSWNGQNYLTTGSYSVTLISSAGCDSVATLNLTVNPVVTSTTDINICNNQLPYSWNGQTYASGGTYSVTLNSSTECDSVITLHLTVTATITSTTNVAVCTNQLPYSWNGQSYPAAGTYSVTLTGSGGCDSIATLILSSNPVLTSTTNVAVCTNQLPYNWNGQSYPVAGTYSVTLTGSGGCDSIATLILSSNPVLTSTTNVAVCTNQLPYNWNGQSYPVAGAYSVTLTGSGGCDSIATLILSSNPVLTSTTNVAVCTNQLPYNWNGQSYPVAGTYSVTLTGSGGCDSIATLILSSNPVLTSTTNVAVCTNQFPYNWNGQSYPVAGTYSVTLTGSGGCDSIATLILSSNPVLTSTTNVAVCTNQLPYSWNGQSYPVAGTYSVTLTSSGGCDSIATLILTSNPALTSTTNVAVCTNQLPYSWNGQSYPVAGTYSVTLTSSGGCDSIATLILTSNPTLTSTTNITVCTNQLPYNWNGQSYPVAGTYSVTLTSSGGCDSIATLILSSNPALTSTTNVAVCTNQLPYNWNGQSYPVAGTYSVTLTSSSGCDSIATLILSSNPVLTSTSNVAVCTNQLPYNWNGQSYPVAGTYSVTLTGSGGCDSIATLILSSNPVLTSTSNVAVCTNQLPYSWNGQSYPLAGTYSVTLTGIGGCDSIATLILSSNPVLTSTTNITVCTNQLPYNWNGQSYPVAGTYSVTLTGSGGCDSIATLILTSSAVLTSTTNISVCTNQLPYNWNGQSYSVAGTYSVTLTGSGGCDSIATLILTSSAVLTSTTNITICTNQLPYNWNGQSYPIAGTYSVTLTGSGGCDSIATLILSSNPVLTSTTNVAVCTNQLPYNWNGQSYPVAGTYSVTLTGSGGCDSIATLILSSNPVLTSTTNVAVCTNQLPYSWNGQSYPVAGTYSVTLTGSGGCDSIATLILTSSAVLISTTNITICTNQLPYNWNGQSYPIAGTYSVTLTGSGGCDSIATLILSSNPVLTSTTNVAVCTNQLPYNWNGQSYPVAGTYSVTLTGSGGCDSIATLILSSNPVLTSTTNVAVCTNQLPYNWNGQSYPVAGTYSVTLTGSGGCDSIATLILSSNPVLTSTTNITVCTNQLPYNWNGQSYPVAGTYSVTLTGSGGCDSIATLILTSSAVLTSTTNITICTNQLPYNWNGQSYPIAGTYSVTLTGSGGCDSIATLILTSSAVLTSTTNITVCTNQLPYNWNGQSYPVAGTYSVTLTGSGGCDSIATLILTSSAVLTSTTNITVCTNQLPYNWNGQSYPVAGTYSVTLTGSGGCDSIATLILTSSAVLTSTTNITVCTNQLPYNWNGQSYPVAGTYSVTLTGSGGCDSIATLILSSNPVLTSTTNVAVCTNQLPYSWNGQSYPVAGTYSVTLTGSGGCDSIATLILSSNPVLTSTTNVAVCTNQLPYNWNGQSYPVAGTYSVTLTGSGGCDSIATLILSSSPVLTSTTNEAVCTNQLPYSWNGQSYPVAGTYSVTLTGSGGCDSIATLILTSSTVLTSTTNITVCTNQLPYNWNGQSYPVAGTYSVTLTGSGGCDSIATLILTSSAVLTSTTDITVCTNQLPYNWNGQSYPVAGTYSVTLTGSGGCDSIATLILTSSAVLTSTTNITICTNQLPYNWNGQSYPVAGTYSVTLTGSGGCDSIATLILTSSAVLTSTTNITVCTNQLPYNWNGQSYPVAGTYSVTLTGSGGCDSIATLILTSSAVLTSTTNITICTNQLPYNWNGQSYPIAGTYSVTLTGSGGCDSIATLILSSNPVLTSTTNVAVCTNQLPYNWNGQSYPVAGTYSVTLTGSGGCDSIATLILTSSAVLTSTTNITICTNQLPYNWNGQSYPVAGTYSVTLTGSGGCDSIATLILTSSAVLTSTTDITVCTNQLPYNWNGQSYPVAGTYSVTLTGSGGCDSIATLILSSNPVLTSTTNVAVCTNQLPYNWNGQSYPVAGTYSVTLTGSGGCDSIATLILSLNPVLTSTTNVAVCTNQLPYNWNGQSYPVAGTYSVTLTGSGGCDSIATLILTSSAVLTSTTNITICTNQLPYNWNGQSYPVAGTYSVTLTGSGGCDSIATLILTSSAVLTSTTNITVCTNQLPYNWNGQSYPVAGTYSVTLTGSGGCDSIATLILTSSAVLTSTTDITVCTNQLPYNWNGQSYPVAGTYSVTLTGSGGCDSIATLILSSNPVLTSTTNVAVCTNQLPYSWNGQSYPVAGTYSVTLTGSGGCDSIATLILTSNPVLTSNTVVTICINQLPYNWNGQSYPAAGTYNITLSGSAGCDSIATLVLNASLILTSTTNVTVCTNQLPYNWNGQSYPAAGTYNVTLNSSSGCDSITTLNLTTNPIATSNTNTTICSTLLPYTWNGQSYPGAGTYSATLVSAAGCDSIATLILSVNPALSSTTSVSVCSNLLPYAWNGQSYSTPGIHVVTLTGSSGCDSVATLNLIVKATSSSITNTAVCPSQLPYSWNGQSYLTAGPHVVTLVNSSGCDSLATLNLTINPVTTSTTIVNTCTSQLPYNWNGQAYGATGIYNIALTNSHGCDSIATLDLHAFPVTTSLTQAVTCNNQLPYSWNGQSYLAGGTYTVTLANSNGCDSIATLQLTVNPVVTSTTNVTICSSSLPYQWNGQSYGTGGAHVITLTSAAGCDSVATLNLTVNPSPPAPVVNPLVFYCQHEAASVLTAAAITGNHIIWYTAPAGGTGSSSAPIPSTASAGSISYYVSQANASCEGPRAMITVTVNSNPVLGPDKPLKICFNSTGDLTTLYNTAGNSVAWTFNQQPVTNPAFVQTPGTYQLVLTNSLGCKDTATVHLTVQPEVIANAGPDGNAEYNIPYQLNGSGGVQYQWIPGYPLLNGAHIPDPLATLTDDQTFILIVKDEFGCADTDTVKIRVFKGPTFYVPTAFSPNGDGLNDIFRPTAVGIASMEYFRVFNRYGELVYESSDLTKGWDGTYRGEKQNIDNYVWTIKGVDRAGHIKQMKGNVVLVR